MTEINEFERYFDMLLNPLCNYDSEHPLIEDSKRYTHYKLIIGKMELFINNFNKANIDSDEPLFFYDFIKMSYDDMDSCLRTVALDELVHENDSPILEELSYLFEHDYYDLTELIRSIRDSEELLLNYNDISNNLLDAKLAIIAKDKKMIEVLRSAKFGLDKQLEHMGVRKRPKKNSLKKVNQNRDKLNL